MKFPPLSQLTTELFALPPTAQRQSNLCSMVNFYPEMKRLMDAVSMSSITEIGSEAGENTAALLEYAKARNLQLTTVDPIDVPFPFDRNTTPCFTFFQGTSKDYLQGQYQCTVMFMDGDHNYETVINDLTAIHNRRRESGIKIVFLHDVSWPWARRDLYYSLDRVNTPHPNQTQSGVSPYQTDSQYYLPSTGYSTANSEGTLSNGVLTAVEDFTAANSSTWQYWHIPVIYGIGILLCLDNLEQTEYDALNGSITELLRHREILATLELNRIENLCYIQSLKDEIQRAGDVWRSDQRYIDEVNKHLSDFTQKLNSINSQFEYLQKIDSEKNARIDELRKSLDYSIESGNNQKNTAAKLLMQIEQLQVKFDHEKKECAELQKNIKSLTDQLLQLELDKNNADHTIRELKNAQAVAEQKLRDETALRQKASAEHDAVTAKLNLALTEKASENTRLHERLATNEQLAVKLSSLLQKTTEERDRVLQEKDAALRNADMLKKSLLDREDENKNLLNQVILSKKTEEQLQIALTAQQESAAAITQLDTALTAKVSENTLLQNQLNNNENTIASLHEQLQKTAAEYRVIQLEKSEISEQLHTVMAEKDDLAQKLSMEQKVCHSLRAECEATHAEVWKQDQEIRRLNLENLAEHWRIEKRGWMHAITYRQCNKKKFARMKEMLQSGAIKVLSLDVFDTLLMRCRHSELQRFMDMGKIWHKKFPAISADSFYAARALAHRIAYQSQISVQGCREPQASAIFKCMCSILHLAEEDADTLAAMELEYEAAHLRLNPAVGELIRIAKEQNVKVIAVSDMYWKSDAISKLIKKAAGETLRMDRVYSSSDTGISKSSGLLFDYVLKEEQCTSSAMLHIGDNKESDCVRPYLRHGINAVWIPRPDHYNHYCKKQQKKYMKQLKKRGIINGL